MGLKAFYFTPFMMYFLCTGLWWPRNVNPASICRPLLIRWTNPPLLTSSRFAPNF